MRGLARLANGSWVLVTIGQRHWNAIIAYAAVHRLGLLAVGTGRKLRIIRSVGVAGLANRLRLT